MVLPYGNGESENKNEERKILRGISVSQNRGFL